MNNLKVTDIRPYLGCDPEFFFKFKGEIVGAEKFIPTKGLTAMQDSRGFGSTQSKFIIDGVQAELNPRPDQCRANLANEIAACFKTLYEELKKRGNDVTADFSRIVEISKENLMQLDEKSRMFGCAPSKTIYKTKAGVKIADVDPTEYRVRAAGGHIHIGTVPFSGYENRIERALTTDHKKTVAMLDLICGNTCVLVDRDPGNIERRKVYGKAGEFRLPAHGLEYRTLSNFWLTAYPLMSMAFGMARLAVQIVADPNHEMLINEFTNKVKAKNVRDAINNNDFDLAMDNFSKIENLILELCGTSGGAYPIDKINIKEFYYFISKIQSDGLGYWFKEDPLMHWVKLKEAHTGGFYDYLLCEVKKDMVAKTKAA